MTSSVRCAIILVRKPPRSVRQYFNLLGLLIWEDNTIEPSASQSVTAPVLLPRDETLVPTAGLEQMVCEEQPFSSEAVLPRQPRTWAMRVLTCLKTLQVSTFLFLSHTYSVVGFSFTILSCVTCISCHQPYWTPSRRIGDLIKRNLWDQE